MDPNIRVLTDARNADGNYIDINRSNMAVPQDGHVFIDNLFLPAIEHRLVEVRRDRPAPCVVAVHLDVHEQ
jgi:hypothetical protein